jgi:hypothetical protein
MKSIYIPKDINEAINIAQLLDNRNAQDLVKCHAAFGHHFNGDIGLVQTQSFCLRGKPSLGADAMAGICRNSGLVRFMRISSWTAQQCTMEFSRKDEPSEIVHTFVYTIEMAQAQGLTNNRNWKTMPLQMLRSRVLTMGLRATFPDAVSGIYSADEIADNTNMSDDERAQISADSLGEEINIRQAPQQRPVQTQHVQAPKEEPKKVQKKSQLKKVWSFNTEEEFWDVVEEHGISREEAQGRLNRQKIDSADMNPEELEDAFYSFLRHDVLRKSWANLHEWWKHDNQEAIDAVHGGFVAQYPQLKDCPPHIYGPRIIEPAYAELVSVLNRVPEEYMNEAKKLLTYMKKNDWTKVNEFFDLCFN